MTSPTRGPTPSRPWHEEQLQARITARLAELGLDQTNALRRVGASVDLIRKIPTQGRRIDSLEEIARALEWTLPELLGITPPADIPKPELDRRKMATAFAMANRAVGSAVDDSDPARIQFAADAIADFYAVLNGIEKSGKSLEEADSSFLDAIISAWTLSRKK